MQRSLALPLVLTLSLVACGGGGSDDPAVAAITALDKGNFESALDARYAIAQGLVWSAFIHPLSSLTEAELISAMAQTFNTATTYGKSYSSGMFHFRGGDNRGEIFEEIIERGTPL